MASWAIKKMDENEIDDINEEFIGVVRSYLEDNVIKPALETVDKDFDAQNQFAEFIILYHYCPIRSRINSTG